MVKYLKFKKYLKCTSFSIELVNYGFGVLYYRFLCKYLVNPNLNIRDELWVNDVLFNKVFDWYFDVYYSFFVYLYIRCLEEVYYSLDKGFLEFFGPLGLYYLLFILEQVFVSSVLSGLTNKYLIIILFNFFIINNVLMVYSII